VYERVQGSGKWHARYRINGKLVRKSFGRDRAAAINWVDKARTTKLSGGGFVPTSAKEPIKSATELAAEQAAAVLAASSGGTLLGEPCEGLLKQVEEWPNEYKDQKNPPYRVGVIKEAFGPRPAASIKVSEISDWFRNLPGAPATQNRYRAMFSAIYNYGAARPDPEQPRSCHPTGSRRQRGNPLPAASEEERIRKVLQEDIDACGPRNERHKKRMIHRVCEFDVALFAGMREGEQYDLTWDDVNFETKEAIARHTKNGTSRQVHLTKTAIKALRTLKQMSLERKDRSKSLPNQSPDNAVFALRDNKTWWGKVLRRAKVKNFRWHDLRHTFCSRLAQRGVDIRVIQELAGHKTIQMSARYSHLNKTSVLKGLAVLEENTPEAKEK
jgi:integrase